MKKIFGKKKILSVVATTLLVIIVLSFSVFAGPGDYSSCKSLHLNYCPNCESHLDCEISQGTSYGRVVYYHDTTCPNGCISGDRHYEF